MKEQELNRYWKKIISTMNDGLFLIGPDGVIAAVWRKVNVFRHVGEVREKLKELAGSG